MPALISGRVHLATFGGGGEETGLVCGYLACDAELIKPVLASLPRVLRVNLRTDKGGEWFENTLRHAVEQAGEAGGGFGGDGERCDHTRIVRRGVVKEPLQPGL